MGNKPSNQTAAPTPSLRAGMAGRAAHRSLICATLGLLGPHCTEGGRSSVQLQAAANYVATVSGITSNEEFAPGELGNNKIQFHFKSVDGTPVQGLSVAFKVFDVTALALSSTDDATMGGLLRANWDTPNPVFYSDQTTTLCTAKTSCTEQDQQSETERASYASITDWLGVLSGTSPASDKGGTVSAAYKASSIFDRTLAIAVRPVAGQLVSPDFLQFVRVKTSSIADFLRKGAGGAGPVPLTIVPLPEKVLAGRQFSMVIQTPIPDTGTQAIDFDIDVVTHLSEAMNSGQTTLPRGKVSCRFRGGQCVVPGGPFKAFGTGYFKISVTPPAGTQAMAPLVDFMIPVARGPASRLTVSSTPPALGVTPVCAQLGNATTNCLVMSADMAKLTLYPALLDDGGNYVGTVETSWSATGPFATSLQTSAVGAEIDLLPSGAGSGTIRVTTNDANIPADLAFTYVVQPGVPRSMTIASEHSVRDEAVESATVPFKALVKVYDAKQNLCTNYAGSMTLSFTATNALASVPPQGSNWTPMQPVSAFSEVVSFKAGAATTSGTFTLAAVTSPGGVLPTIRVDGAVGLELGTSIPMTVQPGPPARLLLRTASANTGTIWANDTAIRSDVTYFFHVAGYDAAGNFAGDIASKFYGVPSGFNIGQDSTKAAALSPGTYASASTCPAPPDPQPEPLSCPIHRSILQFVGTSTPFSNAGVAGQGRVLAIPQLVASPGLPPLAPILSPVLLMASGAAIKFRIEGIDVTTSQDLPEDPQTGNLIVQAGRNFKLRITAVDALDIPATDYSGSKELKFVTSSKASWTGLTPSVPSGQVTCIFSAGSCVVPGPFTLYDAMQMTAVSVQEVTPPPANVIPRVWSTLMAVQPGPEKRIYVATRKGGPSLGSQPFVPVDESLTSGDSTSASVTLRVGEELALAGAVTDVYGNWLRDLGPSEGVWDGTTSLTSPAVPNDANMWTPSDTFAALTGVGQSSESKFLPISSPQVLAVSNKDATKYDIVFQPADRLGQGWILVRSSSHASLVAQPSRLLKITPGAPDHVEMVDKDDLNNLNQVPGACFAPRLRIHDKRHNLITDYTTTSRIALKWFKQGSIDAHPGDFAYLDTLNGSGSTTLATSYRAGNQGPFPSLYRAGFFFSTILPANEIPKGGPYRLNFGTVDPSFPSFFLNSGTQETARGQSGTYYEDWWSDEVGIVSGEIVFPGKLCLWDGRQQSVASSALRELQVDIPANTIWDAGGQRTFPALVSRGAATLSSTATPHAQADAFTTRRGSPDHVHLTLVDSAEAPIWLPRRSNDSIPWIVESPCPLAPPTVSDWRILVAQPVTPTIGLCGAQVFYAHTHDSGCNFLGPASPEGASLTNRIIDETFITAAPPGALGSAAFTVHPKQVPYYAIAGYSFLFRNRDSGLFPAASLNGVDPGVALPVNIFPGAPSSLVASLYGGVAMMGEPLPIRMYLLDQYNNGTGITLGSSPATYNFYHAPNRRLTAQWDAQNSPKGTPPSFQGILSQTIPEWSVHGISFPATAYRANDPITVQVQVAEVQPRVRCNQGANQPCPPPLQTLTGSLTYTPKPGTPEVLQILSEPTLSGVTIPDGYQMNPATTNNLSVCAKDSEGNIVTCDMRSAAWTVTGMTPDTPGDTVLSFSPTDTSAESFTGKTALIAAFKSGSAKINAQVTSPLAASLTTGRIDVPPGVPSQLTFEIPATPLVAGTPFTVEVVARDIRGNVARGFSGSKTLTLGALNDINSVMSCYSNSASYPRGVTSLTFTNGRASFPVTLYIAGVNGFRLSGSYPGGSDTHQGIAISGISDAVNVQPSTLQSYVSKISRTGFLDGKQALPAKASPDDWYGDENPNGSRFDLNIRGIDAYGNIVDMSQPGLARDVTISMIAMSGQPTTGQMTCQDHTTACFNNLRVNSVQGLTLSKLAFDQGVATGGMIYVTDGVRSSRAGGCENTAVTFVSSRQTVARYNVNAILSAPTAGTTFPVQVTALDNSGHAVLGADSDLSGITFDWTDGNGAVVPSSPPPASVAPVLPSSLSFANGIAQASVSLYAAPQTLSLKLRDNQSPARTGASGSMTVTPSLDYRYTMAASRYPSGVPLANGTTLTADCSSTGLFNLTIQATDAYSNPKIGEGSLRLVAVPEGSSPFAAAALRNSGLPLGGASAWPWPYNILAMSDSQALVAGACYGVPHKVTFTLTNTTGTILAKPTLDFASTIDTIDRYDVTLSTYTFAAGTPVPATVRARDWGGNIINGLDDVLNGQTYTWMGAGVSPAPSNLGVVLGAPNAPGGLFVGGTANTTLRFHKAESIANLGFRVVDNRSVTYNSSQPRSGAAGAITVTNDLPSKYVLTAPTSSNSQVTIGDPFALALKVSDVYDNPSSEWASDTLTWSWTNAPASVLNPASSTVSTPNLPAQGSTSFAGGATLPGAVTLFRTTSSPSVLSVTGTRSGVSVTKSGDPLSASLSLAAVSTSDVAYVYLTDGGLCRGNGDCGTGSTRQNSPVSLATSNTKQFYTHGFDQYGNYKGNVTSGFALSDPNTGTLSSGLAGVTTFTALAAGTTSIAASCTNLSAGCMGDTTGTITVSSGGLVFEVTHPASVTAGTPVTVTVRAKDSLGNIAADFTGSKTVSVALVNDYCTTEGFCSTYPGGTQSLLFSSGVATFAATVFSTGTNFQFQVFQMTPTSVYGVSATPLVVVSKPLDHFVTTPQRLFNGRVAAKSTLDQVYADTFASDGFRGSRFDVLLNARDAYGNAVNMSGANARTVTLSLKKMVSDALVDTVRPLQCLDATQNCLANIVFNESSGAKTIAGLGYDLSGDHLIWAQDQNGIPTSSVTGVSTPVTFSASRLTVKQYQVTAPTAATAGTPFVVVVKALDNSGTVLTGADVSLGNLSFTWTDASGISLPSSPAPTGQAPDMPSSLTFSGGVANTSATLYKAPQSLQLKVTDSQATARSGTTATSVSVVPAAGYKYRLYAFSYPAGTPLADNTFLPADGSPTGAFNVRIDAFDPYDNSKAGEGGVGLVPVPVNGAGKNNGYIANSGRSTTFAYGPILQLASGTDTLSQVYYNVAQTIKLGLSNSQGTIAVTPTLAFQNTIHTVHYYSVQLASANPVAGTSVGLTVRAYDTASNVVPDVDDLLNAQTYTWSGPGTSPSPSLVGLTLGSSGAPANLFNQGVATTTVTFGKAETIAQGNFIMTDNHDTSYRGARTGTYGPALSVRPGDAKRYILTANSTSPVVGQPFALNLAVVDTNNNPVDDWASDTLAWSWSGASSSVGNPKTTSVYQPSRPSDGSTSFTNGLVTLSAFALYRASESPILTVTGTNTARTVGGAPLAASLTFSPQIDTSVAYVYITGGPVCSGIGSCTSGSTRENATSTLSIGTSKSYYAHGFDRYGNYKGLASVNWSSAGTATLTLSPSQSASSTTVSPQSTGEAVVTADCTNLAASCLADSTGAISIAVGSRYFSLNYPTSVTAGTPFTVTARVLDANGNIDTTYSGNQSVTITAQNATATAEGYSVSYPSGNQTLSFAAGLATFNATAFNAGNNQLYFQISQASPQSIFGTGPVITSVLPLALHHYATTVVRVGASRTVPAKSTLDSNYADTLTGGVAGSRFDARVYARDLYGNAVNLSGTPRTLTMSLRKSDGTTASVLPLKCSDNTQSCLSNVTANATSGLTTVSGLAYDIGGTHYIWVVDENGVQTLPNVSPTVQFTTSRSTVHHYNLTTPTNAAAGTPFVTTIAAIDNAGLTVTGADSDLASMTFAWSDSSGNPLATSHVAPDGTSAPSTPTTSLPFGSGSASVSVTLYKAETLTLAVADNQTTPKSGTAPNSIAVNYSADLRYRIVSSLGQTAAGIAADPTGTFNLTITALDPYLNPRPGESSAVLRVVRQAGASSLFNVEGTGLPVSSGGVQFNALSGSAVVAGAYYRVAQTVTFGLANSSGSILSAPVHTFASTMGSVAAYGVSHPTTATAGPNNLTLTVSALDPAGNVVNQASVDTALSSQTYTWTGASASPSGTGSRSPSFPSTGYSFAGGVASIQANLYNAVSTTLTVTDNNTAYGLGTRRGTSVTPVVVSNHTVSKYALSATTNPQAGASFNVTVKALDTYNNLASDWASDHLTFTWSSGGSPSVANPKNATILSSAVQGAGTRNFASGLYTTSTAPFVLYRAGEGSILRVDGTNTSTASGFALGTTLAFTPQANSSTGYILMTDGVLCTNGLGTSCTGSNVLNQVAFAMTTDIPRNLYAHGFDPFGNYKALTSVAWSGTNELSGKLSPASGSQTSLAATAITATSGTVTADCSTLSGCLSAATGAIVVSYGSIAKLALLSSPFVNATTDSCSAVTAQVQDNNNNPVTVAAPVTLTFTNINSSPAVNDGVFYSDSGCSALLSGGQGIIPSGENQITVYFRKATVATATSLRAAYSTYSASQTTAIGIGTLRKIAFTTGPLTQTASSGCGAIAYNITDNSGNVGTLSSTPTLFTFTTTSTPSGGTFFADASCSTALSSSQQSLASVSGGTVYYRDLRAGNPTLTIAATLPGGAVTISQAAQTIHPGAFDFATPLAGTAVKGTQAVTWTASAGAKDYALTYGSGSCSTGPVIITAPTVTWTGPTGNVSNFRVCVTARGHDANLPALTATSNATYFLLVDNTVPTQTITVPASTVTMIGPITAATGAASGTTTFAGTASDPTTPNPPAGVSTVQVSLRNNSNSQYWTGSGWTGSATWNDATGTSSWTYPVANSQFTHGTTYSLSVRTLDGAGNTSTATTLSSLQWTSSAPTATLSGAPTHNGFTNSTALNVTVGGTSVVKYQFALVTGTTCSGATYGPVTNIASKISSALSNDVQYTLCVLGLDQAENVQSTPTSVTFTRDRVVPVVSVGSPNTVLTNGSYNLGTASTPPSATDALAGVATTTWTTAAPTATNCTAANLSFSSASTLTPTVSVSTASGCTYGTFVLTLTATDNAGNANTATMTFNFDTRAPTISSMSAALGSYTTGSNIDITVNWSKTVNVTGTPQLTLGVNPTRSASYLSGSGTTALVFRYTVQSGDNTASNPSLYATNPNTALSVASVSLNGGSITDTVGLNLGANTTPSPNSANIASLPTGTSALTNSQVVIDTSAPTTTTAPFAAASLPGSQSNILTSTVSLQSNDVATFKWCVVQGASCPAIGSCSTSVTFGGSPQNFTFSSIAGLPDGAVTLCSYATDRAGNVQATPTSYTWTKDTVAPVAFTISGSNPGKAYTSTPTLSWSAPAADVATITLKIAGTSSCTSPVLSYNAIPGTSATYTLGALTDGSYYACMTAADVAGNTTTIASYVLEVETTTGHLAYTTYDGVTTYTANYAQWSQDSWTKEAIKSVTSGTMDARLSLALDGSSVPYVTYRILTSPGSTLYMNNRAASWGSETAVITSASADLGKWSSIALDSFNYPWIAMQNIISSKDTLYLNQWDNVGNCLTACNPGAASLNRDTTFASLNAVNDTSVAVASSASGDYVHFVYSYFNGTNWKLRYRQYPGSALYYEEVPLATGCTDAEFASVFIKPGTVANQDKLALAYACVTNTTNTPCTIYYTERTSTNIVPGANGAVTGTWSTAQTIGTPRASCSVATLTAAMRPSVVVDRRTGFFSHVAWYNYDTNKIIRSSNESGSWVSQDAATGLIPNNAGSPSLALDSSGMAYIAYLNNGGASMVTNNSRFYGVLTGGWGTPTVLQGSGVTGLSPMAISGMRGRSLNTGQ